MATPEPVEVEPAPRSAREQAHHVALQPATVADCRSDYLAGADIRAKFDATAKRQHRR